MDSDSWYIKGAVITGVIAFLILWIYAFSEWGFLIGLAIGWLPAIIGACIIAAVWPLIALAIAAIVLFLIYSSK